MSSEAETNYWYNRTNNENIASVSEYNLFALVRPKIFIDGNQWCVLYGENLQDGIAGFGDTAYKAVLDFNRAFHQTLPAPGE